ncbi:MAG: hypothetical protein GX802_01610 [Clostridiales bacterium]|jgi:hypothetical protein|nr:hypothetical protein [Clostridiales bacterium]
MKKKVFCLIVCCVIILSFQAKSSLADFGPKPYLIIDFKGIEGEDYYITFLSEKDSPHQIIKEDNKYYDLYQKFANFTDTDGYRFTYYFIHLTKSHFEIKGYEVPQRFKILLYFPKYDSFAVSDKPYEQYAYNSYYIADLRTANIKSSEQVGKFTAETNYDFSFESNSFVLRIIATIGIEILIALIFGFRQKKQLLLIVLMNIVTQTLLNILLNTIHYKTGIVGFIYFYFWLETLVFVIEAIVYANILRKVSKLPVTKGKAVFYAWTANTVSFFVGVIIGIIFTTTIL